MNEMFEIKLGLYNYVKEKVKNPVLLGELIKHHNIYPLTNYNESDDDYEMQYRKWLANNNKLKTAEDYKETMKYYQDNNYDELDSFSAHMLMTALISYGTLDELIEDPTPEEYYAIAEKGMHVWAQDMNHNLGDIPDYIRFIVNEYYDQGYASQEILMVNDFEIIHKMKKAIDYDKRFLGKTHKDFQNYVSREVLKGI